MSLPTIPRVTAYADPVGMVEVAQRLGVAYRTVVTWGNRKVLPARDYTVGGRPAWEWATIRAWAEETGRLPT